MGGQGGGVQHSRSNNSMFLMNMHFILFTTTYLKVKTINNETNDIVIYKSDINNSNSSTI